MKYINNNKEQYIISYMQEDTPMKFYFFQEFANGVTVDNRIAIVNMTAKNSCFSEFCDSNSIKYYVANKNTLKSKLDTIKEPYVLVVKAPNTIFVKNLDQTFIDLAGDNTFGAVDVPQQKFMNIIDYETRTLRCATRNKFIFNDLYFGVKENYIKYIAEANNFMPEFCNGAATELKTDLSDTSELIYLYYSKKDVDNIMDYTNNAITVGSYGEFFVTNHDNSADTVAIFNYNDLNYRTLMLF